MCEPIDLVNVPEDGKRGRFATDETKIRGVSFSGVGLKAFHGWILWPWWKSKELGYIRCWGLSLRPSDVRGLSVLYWSFPILLCFCCFRLEVHPESRVVYSGLCKRILAFEEDGHDRLWLCYALQSILVHACTLLDKNKREVRPGWGWSRAEMLPLVLLLIVSQDVALHSPGP